MKRSAVKFPTVSKEIAILAEPGSTFGEAIADLMSQLQHMFVDNGVRSFCLIGDDRKIGVSVVAANVATSFAQSGHRTILVETNLSSPRVAEMFGLDPSRPGLSEWILGKDGAAAWSTYMQVAGPNLIVVPAGAETREGRAQLPAAMPQIVNELSRVFDIVICDAPPMTERAGAIAVANAVERTIIVARANQSRLQSLLDFQLMMERHRGVVGGCVYMEY